MIGGSSINSGVSLLPPALLSCTVQTTQHRDGCYTSL